MTISQAGSNQTGINQTGINQNGLSLATPGAQPAPAHQMWDAVAPAWTQSAPYVDRRHAELTRWLLDAAQVGAGDRVIDLGCGPGGVGLAAAERVGPAGQVLLSDISAAMTEAAAARAEQLGLTNVRTAAFDMADLGTAVDGPYDVVLSRDGLQFAGDPGAVLSAVADTLRPGGRVALAVWGQQVDNPWLGLVLDAASEVLGRPMPPPGVHGPFALSDPDELLGLLRAAGLAQIQLVQLDVPMLSGSLEEWWQRGSALAGPLSMVLRSAPDEVGARIRERAFALAAPFAGPSGLELPGRALLVSAQVPTT